MNSCLMCQNGTCTERRGSHIYRFERKKQTNYERIKQMSVKEMAAFIAGTYDINFDKFICGDEIPSYDEYEIQQWLESESD